MRFSAVAVCLGAALAPATAWSVVNGQAPDVIANDDLKVPGESPLELCPGEHADDIIQIKSVDLLPNPPKAGEELVIKAKGVVKETIEEGAYVQLTVKYGLIRLITTKADLCKEIGNVDLECPLEAGEMEITKSVDLPAEIPPGKYTVLADVYTKDDVQITCLTATVAFSRSFFNNEL
ncbi:Phosphatidylglycerol/phosphatidylinositol transfer protein-like protein [Hapsidospora chrysogenum ATCC 11550]|uniref:Phosphatidylglycerol/phosphatidylinositol transfer protein n=1 Tax=Hapsidospora chrysogenum (strain ATCC 11550 / CBS 779.69 / DSM 880 / IAM 14645 / JCM 23072 / IMI 49137) TaxID=857340 RepID=A0A086TCV0_HAPC1|nr:Phosphatidylglycerol/phosphatidylinositol transfer protein-like protein [Hapsidospora chrysogenum ATCC 11550]